MSARRVVTEGKWERWPQHSFSTVSVEKVDALSSYRTRYAVYGDETLVGYVMSRKVESWRKLPSGIRYSLRGTPTEWDYEPANHHRHLWVGYDSRSRAIGRLLASVEVKA